MALGADERGAGALALDQRVGGQGRAVDHEVDVGGRDARLGKGGGNALQDRLLRRPRGGQHLGSHNARTDLNSDVGEGAANIDADAHVTCCNTHRSGFPIATA